MTVLDIVKLSKAELIEWRESGAGKKVYALYDKNAHVAYAVAMIVFYHANGGYG